MKKSTPGIWQNMKEASPVLAWGGVLALVWSLVTLALPLIDPRLFQGVSVWHKPWKFQISVAIYWLTLLFFMSYLQKPSKSSAAWRGVVSVAFAGGLFEVVYITWQAALGQASHYNLSSAFHSAMYSVMAVAAVMLTATAGVVGYWFLRHKSFRDSLTQAMQQAIGWGLVISSSLGIVTGIILGGRAQSGGHWVGGTANDGLGLFLLNWSRDGGDLRVAHFFALHAMQILPLMLLALYLLVPALRLESQQKTAKKGVWLFALMLVLFCIFTLWQAFNRIPFIR